MKNIVHNEVTYSRLYQKNENELLKISALPAEIWKQFCSKNLKHVNNPTNYRILTEAEKQKYQVTKIYKSIITLPYLKEYQTLYDTVFEPEFTTTEILTLLRENLLILKNIHDHDIYHGDIHPGNIMINKKHELQFIDFDSAIVGECVSPENSLYDDDMTIEEQKAQIRLEDKLDVLTNYFSYLSYGDFTNQQNISITGLSLDRTHRKALKDILEQTNVEENYYYIDFIESLIKEGYQSPIVYTRNTTFKSSMN